MKTNRWFGCVSASIFGLLLGGMTAPLRGEVKISLVEYHGWSNSVELSNDQVRVVVVPSVGRVMFYGFKGGDNLLWENPELAGRKLTRGEYLRVEGKPVWANFGGDKVWPTEQSLFARVNGLEWPPDPWFDGSPFRAALLPDGVRLTSPISNFCGARLQRTIRLAPQGSELVIDQRMEKVRPALQAEVEPLPLTIWSITQIRNPEQILFRLNPESRFEKGFYVFPSEPRAVERFGVEDGIGIFRPHEEYSQKTGADSDQWLSAVIEGVGLAILFRRAADRDYPDGGLSTEAYTSPDYTELEILSPLEKLGPGEAQEFTVRWQLKGLRGASPEARRKELLDWLDELVAAGG